MNVSASWCVELVNRHSLPSITSQVGKYQEQPTLLDPLLEPLLQPLATALQCITRTHTHGTTNLQHLQAVCQMIWRLCNTRCALDTQPSCATYLLRGYKVIGTFLTNDAQDLEPASLLLQWLHQQARLPRA